MISIRAPSDFDTLTLSASNRTALITLWTASWCPSCRIVKPIIRDMIERHAVGEEQGGVGYAEIEFDSPTIGAVAGRYMVRAYIGCAQIGESVWLTFVWVKITSIPTLLAFSRQEAQLETRLTSVDEMKDREFLRMWIEDEARRGCSGGKGGGVPSLAGLFGIGRR